MQLKPFYAGVFATEQQRQSVLLPILLSLNSTTAP